VNQKKHRIKKLKEKEGGERERENLPARFEDGSHRRRDLRMCDGEVRDDERSGRQHHPRHNKLNTTDRLY